MAFSPVQKWIEAVRRRRARQAEVEQWLAEHEYPSRLDRLDRPSRVDCWLPEQRPKS
jgi:hypothetical protein